MGDTGWAILLARMNHGPSVITIGNFDGVHLGHAALIRCAKGMAGGDEEDAHRLEAGATRNGATRNEGTKRARVVALAFDPHPAAALVPGSAPAVITPFGDRRELLLRAGADEVKRLVPTPELLSLSPRAFLDRVVQEWGAVGIVEGHDFHFGKGRAGTPDVLSAYARERGLRLAIVDPVMVDLCDQTLVRASSTVVRWLLEMGRVTDAHRVLGRAYGVSGTVVRNDQRGRTIGFPTANLDPASLGGAMLPCDGVYAAEAWLPGETVSRAAAVHVGPRPTFGAMRRVVEVHVIGWEGPLRAEDEYGWRLRIGFLASLREPMRFDGIEGIRGQLGRDVERAAGVFESYRVERGAVGV